MTRARAFTLVAATLALLSAPGSATAARRAQAAPWIAVVGATETAVRPDGDQGVVRFPVTLAAGVNPKAVRLALADVVYDKRRGPSVMRLFGPPQLIAPSATQGAAIELTMRLDSIPGPGSYELVVTATIAGGGRDPVPLALKVSHPAAKLRPISTLVIERVKWGGTTVRTAGLVVDETGAKSQLTGLRIQPVQMLGADGGVVEGKLWIAAPPPSIAPDSAATISIEVRGDFPLGTSKGVLEVLAPQLEAAVPVNVEVRTRWTRWLLAGMILLGLVAGYVSRTLLQRSIELNQARMVIFPLARRLDEETDQGDTEYRKAIEAIRREVDALFAMQDPTKIPGEITRITTKYEKARTDLANRIKTASEQLSGAEQIVRRSWMLPESLRAAIAALEKDVDAARASLKESDLEAAVAALDRVRIALSARLASELGPWRRNVDAIRRELGASGAGIPDAVAQDLRASAEKLGTGLDGVPAADSTFQAIAATLAGMDGVERDLLAILEQLRIWLRRSLIELETTLRQIPLPVPTALESLKTVIAEADAALEARGRAPTSSPELLDPALLARLDAAWRAAVMNQIGAADAQTLERVRGMLDAHRYAQAAQMAVDIIKDRARKEGVALGDADDERTLGERIASIGAWLPTPVSIDLGAGSTGVAVAVGRPLPSVEVTRARTVRQLFAALFAQTVIAGAGIMLVGFLFFAKTFVGTGQELATVFLWGFGLDVTMNTFAGLAKERGSSRA